jgi:2-keto-4-pentenoate hydratase/2-oxohepta-3-ene-1,7-dioic acid hydratase in catechol pathway
MTYFHRKPAAMSTSAAITVYCIGRNYADHAKELNNPVPKGEPIVFLKSPSALRPCASGQVAFPDETFHHEAEIVARIGRPVGLGQPGSWADVDALALGLDLTRREVQTRLKEKGLPWTASKSFAGSAVIAEFLPLDSFPRRDAIEFTLRVNGELRQSGNSRDMLFPMEELLTHLARFCPLLPGDLIYTGTPAGVGPLRKGDRFELAFTGNGAPFTGIL